MEEQPPLKKQKISAQLSSSASNTSSQTSGIPGPSEFLEASGFFRPAIPTVRQRIAEIRASNQHGFEKAQLVKGEYVLLAQDQQLTHEFVREERSTILAVPKRLKHDMDKGYELGNLYEVAITVDGLITSDVVRQEHSAIRAAILSDNSKVDFIRRLFSVTRPLGVITIDMIQDERNAILSSTTLTEQEGGIIKDRPYALQMLYTTFVLRNYLTTDELIQEERLAIRMSDMSNHEKREVIGCLFENTSPTEEFKQRANQEDEDLNSLQMRCAIS